MNDALHTPETIYSLRNSVSWLALACAAGAVNGIGFLTCEQYVSHVTGIATRTGLEGSHLGLAAEYACVLLGFIAGAMTSVIWIQGRARQGKRPQWASPLVAVTLILVGVAIAGHSGCFGPFGGQVATDPPPFVLLSILAFAMGLQNAAVASTTGLAVRTTHLTGPATDFGVHLASAWFAIGEQRRTALKAAALRGGKIVAFIAGAGLSLPLAHWLQYFAFVAPAALVFLAAVLSFKLGSKRWLWRGYWPLSRSYSG